MGGTDGKVERAADKLLTGNVGLYYCCYRLSQLGWNVMPTARNARSLTSWHTTEMPRTLSESRSRH